MVSPNVRIHQPPHECRNLNAGIGPHDEMKVIRHHGEGENPDLYAVQRISECCEKHFVVNGLGENCLSAIASIQ
jgi:hypothetical protein